MGGQELRLGCPQTTMDPTTTTRRTNAESPLHALFHLPTSCTSTTNVATRCNTSTRIYLDQGTTFGGATAGRKCGQCGTTQHDEGTGLGPFQAPPLHVDTTSSPAHDGSSDRCLGKPRANTGHSSNRCLGKPRAAIGPSSIPRPSTSCSPSQHNKWPNKVTLNHPSHWL